MLFRCPAGPKGGIWMPSGQGADAGDDVVVEDRPGVPWQSLTDAERFVRMQTQVMPRMKTMFQAFDPDAYADFSCKTCHGAINEMPEVYQAEMLSMRWCLSCHRDPAPYLRPPSEVTNMAWDPATAGYDVLADPLRERLPEPPTNCSGCHR